MAIGLAFQYTFGTRLYWFSLFLVWLVKLTLLRYGGVRAYRAGRRVERRLRDRGDALRSGGSDLVSTAGPPHTRMVASGGWHGRRPTDFVVY
jgi:hypothetical protein